MGNCRSTINQRPLAGTARPPVALQRPDRAPQPPFYQPAAEGSLVDDSRVYGDRVSFWIAEGRRWLNNMTQWQRRVLIAVALSVLFILAILAMPGSIGSLMGGKIGGTADQGTVGGYPKCAAKTPCPAAWISGGGGYFCGKTGGCREGASGPFPDCADQCVIGNPPAVTGGHPHKGGGGGGAFKPQSLDRPGNFDLRVLKGGRLLGCAAPIGILPGNAKYGCSAEYATAKTCDAAQYPVKNTQYVAAVHDGCQTAQGRGTYGYAYDDGVGLKQCSPLTKYEWILCPTGQESGILWEAMQGKTEDSTGRFRVTNKCPEPVWIAQAGPEDGGLPGEAAIARIEFGASYTYSIPNRGLASTRFLPKTGCDDTGNNCDIQSMPPCPAQGCDLPVDTKFEASWGCVYATGVAKDDKKHCTLTGQGNPSTYQDWWDGSAVDGWTLPFSILVDDGNRGLVPGSVGSPDICGPVVCANLDASKLCPTEEFLTPVS